ncbi:CvfD/Ygs/GSP13 family RNA-binding post-transcriptional regulator [Furfurilactobacillus milii]|uniref:S1 RNA-binding domain-containing protein n=1 Tax=Furfurilactobacillus milii TaxID=2888272 RepID=A0A6N9I591_9LACO|nr:CvfD/Ygs/GSP13 family RNA-binding post-transcriptional regulator [Furfurilactobacillus milii]MYV18048.1 S1 RNA-binding domain-containing protein [Furfurilactobacillus milii]
MKYQIGQTVTGVVTGIQPYGAFISLDETHQGLIHISETHYGFVRDIHDYLKVGQSIKAKILDIDEYSQKISLSLRCLEEDQEDVPVVNARDVHKRYWTNYHVHTGFQPISDAMDGWLAEARQRFLK